MLGQVGLLFVVELDHFCGPTWSDKGYWGLIQINYGIIAKQEPPPEKGVELTAEGGLLSHFLEALGKYAQVDVV